MSSENKTDNLPNFVINFLTLENLQSPNLVENLWFVETDQVMDNHIRGPDVLKNHNISDLRDWRVADKIHVCVLVNVCPKWQC